MKTYKIASFLLSFLCSYFFAQAQTTLHSESFETDGEGVRYTSNTYSFCPTDPDYFLRTNSNPALPSGCSAGHGTALTNLQGTFYWASEDIRSNQLPAPGARPPGDITTSSINITNYNTLKVSLYLATSSNNGTRWESDDSINIKASFDGVNYITVGRFMGNAVGGGRLTIDENLNGIIDGSEVTYCDRSDFTKYIFSIPGTGTSLRIKLDFDQFGGTEELGIDLIEVTGNFVAPANTTWNGTTWSNGTPTASVDAIIASSTVPASFTCKALTINSGSALNILGITATINGNISNNGSGIIGTGNLIIASNAALSGSAISFLGNLTINTGATFTTNNLFTLASNISNTGYVGNSVGNISGNVTVQRYIPAGRRVYRFLSHPFITDLAMSSLTDNIDITGSGGSPFTTTTTNNPSAFSYNNATANSSLSLDPGWSNLTASSSFAAKAGYRILIRGSKGQAGSLTGGTYTPNAVTLDWTGVLNSGNQTFTLPHGGVNQTYSLIGNPYASPIDLSLLTRGSNINANFSVWNPNMFTRGAYETQAFSLISYILPSGSAFFAQTAGSTNNTITFTEASKSTSSAAPIFRTNQQEDQLVLEVVDHTGNYADKLTFFLNNDNQNYTANTDVLWDAEKLMNPDLNFYSFGNDLKKLAIDRRPITIKDTIQLGFTNTTTGNFSFVVKQVPEKNAPIILYLRDKFLLTEKALKLFDTIAISITNDALSQGNIRFEIITKQVPIVVTGTNLALLLSPNPVKNILTIRYTNPSQELGSLRLSNSHGQLLQTIQLGNACEGSYTINMAKYAIGVYTIELRSGKEKLNKQVIKH